MPMLRALVAELNCQFHPDRIGELAKHAGSFAPGKPLDASLITRRGTVEHRVFQAYLDNLPGSFKAMLSGVLHYALSAKTPIPIIFSWTPAYDFEIDLWEAGCGITVQLKGRYPGDRKVEVDPAA